jgi:hypothetical protein
MLSPALLGAQHHYDFNWYIGYEFDGEVIDLSRFNFDGFEFHHTADTVGLEMSGQNVTMSNAEGELLFYSNGCEIRNAQHELIPGSDPLLPGEDDDIFCSSSIAAMPLPQTMLALPFEISSDSTLYYIYQSRDTFRSVDSVNDYYSILEEHLLIEDTNNLQLNYHDSTVSDTYIYTGFLQAIKHANNKDWWLIYPLHLQARFESVLITISGSEGGAYKVMSDYSSPSIDREGRITGQLAASLNGSRLAMFLDNSEFFYLSFNRQTGKIEVLNRDTLSIQDKLGSRGTQFSPNGRFIYLSIDSFVYQLDTESSNFPTDPELIATTFKDHPSGRKDDFCTMQMGPDCKIYISTLGNTDFYHVIHRPNEKGPDCMVEVRGIRLKTLNDWTIPLFPNYRLGTPEENWCDSISDDTTAVTDPYLPSHKWQIWPNPTNGELNIGHEDGNFGLNALRIYNTQGQLVKSASFNALSTTYTTSVVDLPSGLYFVELHPRFGRTTTLRMVKR